MKTVRTYNTASVKYIKNKICTYRYIFNIKKIFKTDNCQCFECILKCVNKNIILTIRHLLRQNIYKRKAISCSLKALYKLQCIKKPLEGSIGVLPIKVRGFSVITPYPRGVPFQILLIKVIILFYHIIHLC